MRRELESGTRRTGGDRVDSLLMDQRPHALSNVPARDTADLLYGDDTTPGIVAVEQLGANRVRLYQRAGERHGHGRRAVPPVASRGAIGALAARRGAPTVETLAGEPPAALPRRVSRLVEPPRRRAHLPKTPVSGSSACARRSSSISCVVAAHFSRRWSFRISSELQIDIETTGLDPHDPDSQIIVVALKIQPRHGGGPVAATPMRRSCSSG